MVQPARHIANVKYAIRNIAAEAARLEATGMKILPCNIGDPLRFDFATPPHLVEAVVKALRDGKNQYVASAGLREAREAVAASMQPAVRPEDVFITSGVSEALDLVLTALLEAGDEVLLPSPGYPLYNAIAARLQATAVPYYLDESRGWAIDAEAMEASITKRTKAIVVCNPNNPTGAAAAAAAACSTSAAFSRRARSSSRCISASLSSTELTMARSFSSCLRWNAASSSDTRRAYLCTIVDDVCCCC